MIIQKDKKINPEDDLLAERPRLSELFEGGEAERYTVEPISLQVIEQTLAFYEFKNYHQRIQVCRFFADGYLKLADQVWPEISLAGTGPQSGNPALEAIIVSQKWLSYHQLAQFWRRQQEISQSYSQFDIDQRFDPRAEEADLDVYQTAYLAGLVQDSFTVNSWGSNGCPGQRQVNRTASQMALAGCLDLRSAVQSTDNCVVNGLAVNQLDILIQAYKNQITVYDNWT